MRVLLRNARGLYFQGLDRWTSQAAEAFDFGNLDDAVEVARGLGLKEADALLSDNRHETATHLEPLEVEEKMVARTGIEPVFQP